MSVNKCPLCERVCKNCKCDEKMCECGHTLGMHRFVKTAKAGACLDDDKLTGKYCKCDKFKEVGDDNKKRVA